MMRNFWCQTEMEQVAWWGHLPHAIGAETLVELSLQVLALADTCGVARMDQAAIHRQTHELWASQHTVELSLTRGRSPRASLAWFDRDGSVVEGDILDPGGLLTTLEPVPGAIWLRDRSPESPLVITGARREYDGGKNTDYLDELVIGAQTFSDIWFPFVPGVTHPSFDGERYFDNRELAMRHTPRLNVFVSGFADLVLAVGGTWSVDVDVVVPQLSPWVTERGILLDGPVPPLMPPELVDVPWPSLDE